MTAGRMPRYPIYIPSKGRWESALTARFLDRDGVPFRLVVEPTEVEQYRAEFGNDRVLVLPFHDLGQGSIPARNWIMQHAIDSGAARHWQLDDNMSQVVRVFEGKRLPCAAGPAFAAVEDFTDRYTNVAISGMNYDTFVRGTSVSPPFRTNVHVYSCTLINNAIPHRWRGRYNEDTDLCLQVLADGWCTILVNAFLIAKRRTMTMGGGNSTDLYQGDGRLAMARSLERQWPHVVEVDRRFQRPQHVIRYQWRKFTTPLQLRPDVDLSALPPVDDYGLKLRAVAPVRSPRLRAMVEQSEDVGKQGNEA